MRDISRVTGCPGESRKRSSALQGYRDLVNAYLHYCRYQVTIVFSIALHCRKKLFAAWVAYSIKTVVFRYGLLR